MPKAEVHLHLEGTIAPETLWALAARNQVALPVGSLEELRGALCLRGLRQVPDALAGHVPLPAARAQDYEQMVDAFVATARGRTSATWRRTSRPTTTSASGSAGGARSTWSPAGCEAAEAAGGPVVRLITDIPSESVPESGPFTAELLEQEANPLVVAIGLGGPEEGFPRTLVKPYFERARRRRLSGGGPRGRDGGRRARAPGGAGAGRAAHPARRARGGGRGHAAPAGRARTSAATWRSPATRCSPSIAT